MSVADFRSDTLTAPGTQMREAMAAAVVGDDVFGEDPTVNELEGAAARFLGQEAALFVPSGTMANQIATHVHCRPGDELICEERSHIYLYEGAGVTRWSGTSLRLLHAESGFPEPDDIRAAARADDPHCPRSRLLVLENTHNMAGGRVLAPEGMRRGRARAGGAARDVARGEAPMPRALPSTPRAVAGCKLDHPSLEREDSRRNPVGFCGHYRQMARRSSSCR